VVIFANPPAADRAGRTGQIETKAGRIESDVEIPGLSVGAGQRHVNRIGGQRFDRLFERDGGGRAGLGGGELRFRSFKLEVDFIQFSSVNHGGFYVVDDDVATGEAEPR